MTAEDAVISLNLHCKLISQPVFAISSPKIFLPSLLSFKELMTQFCIDIASSSYLSALWD